MKPHLPLDVNAILDIGCGVAGIDILLHRHYGEASHIHYYLLDRTEVSDRVFYGYKPEAAFCNSLQVAEALLASNGIQSECIKTLPVSSDYCFEAGEVDLVISLLSWGSHYPIPMYLENVSQCLKPGGVLIVDVRQETDGVDKLMERFPNLQTISEDEKKLRVRAVKD
jgi:SAM-dependent methyltransferase